MKRKYQEKLIVKHSIPIIAIIICSLSLLYFSHTSEQISKADETTTAAKSVTQAINQAEIYRETIPPTTTAKTLFTTASSASSDRSLNISAPCAALYNISNDEILFEKEANKKIHPASLTKLLTAITALTYMDSDSIITVGSELEMLPARSSLCLIKIGHSLTLYDLLTGMLVSSGNDAAYTIAVSVARYVMNTDNISNKEALSYFTVLMNSIAKAIGCTDSNFTNPDGFDDEDQYTTIADLALISGYALNFKEIREIVSTVKKKVVFHSGENVTWSNSNKLLHSDSSYFFSEATGMKTGTTPLAGKSLIATAEINGQTYLAIVANCKSEDERYLSIIKLFESCYSK